MGGDNCLPATSSKTSSESQAVKKFPHSFKRGEKGVKTKNSVGGSAAASQVPSPNQRCDGDVGGRRRRRNSNVESTEFCLGSRKEKKKKTVGFAKYNPSLSTKSPGLINPSAIPEDGFF